MCWLQTLSAKLHTTGPMKAARGPAKAYHFINLSLSLSLALALFRGAYARAAAFISASFFFIHVVIASSKSQAGTVTSLPS